MSIRGTICSYDTLVCRTIAPGSKLTQLQFNKIQYNGSTYKMRAHIITIDLNNQYNSFSPYISKDTYFATNTQPKEISRRKSLGMKPIASMCGGGFVMPQGASSTNNSYEITGSLISDGEIKFETSGAATNYYMDRNKVSHVGTTKLEGYISANGKSFTIGQVNHYRDKVDKKQLITLFCNGMNKSRAVDASTGTDVKVKLINSDKIVTNKEIKCQVISVSNNSCNTFENGEAILSGVGKAANFLNTLNVDDVVTINMGYTDGNNKSIEVKDQITNLFGYCIKEGEVQAFTKSNYPICAIGNSQDGKTSYWAALDITSESNAPCIFLADLLKNIGAYEGIWLDGGPSAEMTVDGGLITDNMTASGGRYIPSGYILYSTAPEDNTITSIEASDPSSRTVKLGQEVYIKLFGYNKYGDMILENAQTSKDIELTCTEGLGTINNGIFKASKTGSGYIYAKVKSSGKLVTIPVNVTEVLTAYPKSLFTGQERACQIKLTYTDNQGTIEIDPSQAEWSKEGKYTISSCANGYIVPYFDGTDYVYVTYKGVSDTITVKVENLADQTSTIMDLSRKIINPQKINLQLPSVPRFFQANISGTAESAVTLTYSLGSGKTIYKGITTGSDGTASITVPLDYDAVDTYPVKILTLSDSAFSLTGLWAIYQEEITGVSDITTSSLIDDNTSFYNLAGQRVNQKHAKGILIRDGKKIIIK